MKTKDSDEKVCGFLTMITTKNRSDEDWFDKGTEVAAEFKIFCKD